MIRYIPFLLIFLHCGSNLFAQTATFTATQVCLGKQTTLTGSSAYNDTLVASWSWDLNNDGIYNEGTGKILNHIFPQADTFLVALKVVTKAGTSDSTLSPIQVIVNPLPDVNFQVDNLCAGKPALYFSQATIQGGSITQFLWDFNNDNIVDDNTGPNVAYTCGPPSVYQTKLECVSDQGCRAFAVKTTQVYPQPAASFTISDNCFGDVTTFTNTTVISGDTLAYSLWDFGDGNQEVNAGSPQHQYAVLSSYSATLITVTSNSCRDTDTVAVNIYSKPALSFQFSGDTLLKEGESVTITAQGTFTSYLWSDGSTLPSITVSDGGMFIVVVTDSNNCTNTLSTEIVVRKAGNVEMRNDILSPNGDGINDHFVIENFDLYEHCSITVYNIWNDVVFKSGDYKNDWDGTNNGRQLDPGAYYFIIQCDDQPEKKGNINILR